jgi:Zn-dependent peptidase ImmA (M78 family)
MIIDSPYLEQRTEKLLKEANCYSLPINVEKCAKHLNVKIKSLELDDDVSGFLLLKDDKTVHIGYNKNNGKHRVRFTIAHELAHLLLHTKEAKLFVDKVVLYRDSKSSTGEILKEREANAFAAALLMPKNLLIEEVEKHKEEKKDKFIVSLAKKFNVSEQAITIRLTNLGLIDYDALAS